MAYYLDLFSPAMYEAFSKSDRTISGFRTRQRGVAQRIKPRDRLVCYMTKLSRWIGILEVESGPFEDATPIFYPDDDPFTIRFRVKSIHWLPVEKCVPIHEDEVWNQLSFTRDQSKNTSNWTGKLRGSLVQISTEDGHFLEQLLAAQATGQRQWPVREDEFRRLVVSRVRGVGRGHRSGSGLVILIAMEAFDASGGKIGQAATTSVRGLVQVLEVRAAGIQSVTFSGGGREGLLLRLCAYRQVGGKGDEPAAMQKAGREKAT